MLLLVIIGCLSVLCPAVAFEYDYPPTADAGPDVVLHIPRIYVTLNGSGSKDDHGSLQYQWTLQQSPSLSDKLDMEGIRTPYLHLSNLQLGDYVFELTVTDTAGQSASSQVHVRVLSAACMSNNTHELIGFRGELDSRDYPSSSCVEWLITGPPSSNIIISFTALKVVDAYGSKNCEGYIELGPLPEKVFCGSLEENLHNQVYISERNHMWIKLVTKGLGGAYFRLTYIASSDCQEGDFHCDNGHCIYGKWKCNGLSECGDWSDEMFCNSRTTDKSKTAPTTHNPPSTRPVPSPVPLWNRNDGMEQKTTPTVPPRLWNRNDGSYNCDTVYCYILAYGRYMCVVREQMCDGRKHCLNGEDEKTEICASISTKKTTTTPKPYWTARPPYWTSKPDTATPYSSSCDTIRCYRYGRYECLDRMYLCNGHLDCPNGIDEEKEFCDAYNGHSSICGYDVVYCWYGQGMGCLPWQYNCDGEKQCRDGEDEDPALCDKNASCNRHLQAHTGWFASPNYPHHYPYNQRCTWVIHSLGESDKQIQLRFVTFLLQRDTRTDYVAVYDGADESFPLIGQYDGSSHIPDVITSSRGWMFVEFVSDGSISYSGFNATYQMKGYCLQDQLLCGYGEECYDKDKKCDGHWDCENGEDESHNCHNCQEGYFTCGPGTVMCYDRSERCDGYLKCSNSADEEDCDAKQCGPHNGTFLCDNKRCIYEEWTCDQRDDCGDFSDEKNCFRSSKRVIIAAISGSVICALLLTILIGCSCKLYSLRAIERHGGIRHHSPMSRLYAEFLRRTAPPPYHEAMLTSRNYDEVQQERCERLRSQRPSRRSSRQENNSQNNPAVENSQNEENPADGGIGERANLIFFNEVEVSENTGSPSAVQDTTGNSTVTIDRSTEAREDQNTDFESDSDSSGDHEENDADRNNVISQDGIEMQATGLSSRAGNVDEQEESSDESCILNHHSDGEETSQNNDNRSVSLDDISMETASASINLELSEISETGVGNHDNAEVEDPDKEVDCEVENMENMRRSIEPKEENSDVIGVGTSWRRNSQESLSSIHSNCTADSDDPLLVA